MQALVRKVTTDQRHKTSGNESPGSEVGDVRSIILLMKRDDRSLSSVLTEGASDQEFSAYLVQ